MATKYNIREKKEHAAKYRSMINPVLMDTLKDKIFKVIVIQEKYKDKDYSAKQLARDLETNTRYISAVINVKFHTNYAGFVNRFRIDEAMALLVDKRYLCNSMEDISDMVGFANRQSFYSSFYRVTGKSPRIYRVDYLAKHPELQEELKLQKAEKKTEKRILERLKLQ